MVETLKQEAQRLLADVSGEKIFWVNNGKALHNMKELGEGLKTMSDDTYFYHANEQKHDFFNWVKDAIGDEILAGNLREASNRTQAIRAVSSRINILSKRLT
jgi:hypothetical protein